MTPEEIERLPYRPCVGVVLANASSQIFCGERIDTPGAWQMPQGGIDEGENARAAAFRELWEETGVSAEHVRLEAESADWVTYDLPHDVVPRRWGGKFRGQKQRWFLMRLLASDDRIDIQTGEQEFQNWRWMAPGDVLRKIVPFKREVYAKVLAEFAEKI